MSEAATIPDERNSGEPDGGGLLRLILRSSTVRLSLVALAIFAILYSIPAVPLRFRQALSTNVGPVLFLVFAVVSCWKDSGKGSDRRSVSFWRIMGLAFLFWLVVRAVLPYTKPFFPLISSLTSDIVYALYYLTMILAIEIRPHLHREEPASGVERSLIWPAVSLFVLGLFAYFVFIPLSVSPQQYATAVPSMYFFLALDLYIGIRLLAPALRVSSPGWRVAYGGLAAAMFGFALGDLIELLQYRKALDLDLGGPSDLVWLVPFLGVIIAGRTQVRLPGRPESYEELFGPQQQLIVLAFVLPVIHFIGYGLEIFESAGQDLREVVTLFWLLLLGSLAFTQQILLQRRTRRLALETHEATEALRQSERTVRLMTDRQKPLKRSASRKSTFPACSTPVLIR